MERSDLSLLVERNDYPLSGRFGVRSWSPIGAQHSLVALPTLGGARQSDGASFYEKVRLKPSNPGPDQV